MAGGKTPQRILFVFDFDNTLIQTDSQLHVVQNIATAEQADQFEKQMNGFLVSEGADWNTFWTSWIEKLWDQHGKELPELFHNGLSDVPMHSSTINFLETIKTSHGNAKLMVLSDANTAEIRSILQHKGLEDHFHDIVAHEAGFNDDGRMWTEVRGRERRKQCLVRDAHLGMCKGIELREFLAAMDAEERPHVVVYCGDGSNDVCGVLGALTERDYVLALEGAALHKHLTERLERDPSSVKPKVLAWKNGEEMESLAMEILRRYS